MRSVFIVLLALICPCFGIAQSNTQSVFNASGFEWSEENSSITSSIGEPAIITLAIPASVITQGYLQPVEREPCTSVSFNYYPNPAKEKITIEAVGCDDQIAQVQIIDVWGRTLSTIAPAKDNAIDLGGLSQGLYVFKVLLKGGTSGNFSAIKVTN